MLSKERAASRNGSSRRRILDSDLNRAARSRWERLLATTVSSKRRVSPSQVSRLQASGLKVYFEGVRAAEDVDFVLNRGEILGLIGPNGAGKTTLVNVLTGFQRPTAGRIAIDDVDVSGWPPHRLGRAGIARTFQSLRLFSDLTVLQNVEVAGVANGFSRARARDQAQELLGLLRLEHRVDERASALPQGEERRLGIARALAMRPTFVLLDEPAAGLNETEADELMRTVRGIRDQHGYGMLLIEHDMRVVMGYCERIHVLDHGRTIAIGTPAEVRTDPAVIRAYLGSPTEEPNASH
jgi:branched-chain amino acid transport system ATP-binding protein